MHRSIRLSQFFQKGACSTATPSVHTTATVLGFDWPTPLWKRCFGSNKGGASNPRLARPQSMAGQVFVGVGAPPMLGSVRRSHHRTPIIGALSKRSQTHVVHRVPWSTHASRWTTHSPPRITEGNETGAEHTLYCLAWQAGDLWAILHGAQLNLQGPNPHLDPAHTSSIGLCTPAPAWQSRPYTVTQGPPFRPLPCRTPHPADRTATPTAAATQSRPVCWRGCRLSHWDVKYRGRG